MLAQNQEIQRVIDAFVTRAPDGAALQALEPLLRQAFFSSARELFQQLLQQAADRIDAEYQVPPGLHCKGRTTIAIQCMFGWCELTRNYYYRPAEQRGHCPVDAALALEGGATPALFRLVCLEGADEASFQKAQEHLKETGGIEVPARQIQRALQRIGPAAQAWPERDAPPEACDAQIMYVSGDGTGVPMRRKELAGRKGKQPDGSAKTRQVYLACVFTQHTRDAEGHPIRDHQSTSYLSTFAPIAEFGLLMRKDARRRGSGTAGKIILLLDGALGLENHGKINFPGALQIVDFYHAVEHLKELLEALFGKGHPDVKKLLGQWKRWLLRDRVQKIIDLAKEQSRGRAGEEKVTQALHYFEHNVERMQYGTYRQLGYFIGSGVVEAGCKTLIGGRCKQSGMFWTRPGAQSVLALRCIRASRQWDTFWQNRANEHAARNDTLALAA